MGGVVEQGQPVEAILEALVAHDAGAALVAVAAATEAGREPRALGEALIARLRDGFLAVMGAPDRQLPAADLERAAAIGGALGPAGLTRALEVLGEALVELAKKPDPRIVLEVALVRLCRPDADRSLDAVLDRLERLERSIADGVVAAPRHRPPARPRRRRRRRQRTLPPSSARRRRRPRALPTRRGRSWPRLRARGRPPRQPGPRVTKAHRAGRGRPTSRRAPAGRTGRCGRTGPARHRWPVPSRDELTLAWGDHVLDALPRGTKAIYSTGRFVDGDGAAAVFALANVPTRDHCEKKRAEVEKALAAHFGRPVPDPPGHRRRGGRGPCRAPEGRPPVRPCRGARAGGVGRPRRARGCTLRRHERRTSRRGVPGCGAHRGTRELVGCDGARRAGAARRDLRHAARRARAARPRHGWRCARRAAGRGPEADGRAGGGSGARGRGRGGRRRGPHPHHRYRAGAARVRSHPRSSTPRTSPCSRTSSSPRCTT